jgi:hypothetical protein
MQKFWGVFLSDRPAYYLMVGALIPATLTGFITFNVSVPLLLGTPLMVASLTAIGLSQSVRSKSKASAIIFSMAIVFVIWIITSALTAFFNCGGELRFGGIFMMAAIPPLLGTLSSYYFSFWFWGIAMLLAHVFHISLTAFFLRLAIIHVGGEPRFPINAA